MPSTCTLQLYKNTISGPFKRTLKKRTKLVLPALDKILTLGRINKLILLSLNRIFRGR